jgi:DNA ligase-1
MTLPTLYARTNTDAVQQWTVTIEGDKYCTTFGQVDGKLQTTNWTECFETNGGKANERNPQKQALFEAQALWKKKKDSGYFENIKDIDKATFVEPMLAKKFEDYEDSLTYPVVSERKLDGIRNITTKDGMFSRNGKEFKSCPHILKELQYFFEKFPSAVLDGELYCDKLNNDFNKICSLVKKAKPSAAELEEASNTIQYWIYDWVLTDKKFSERYEMIKEHIKESSCIKIVTADIANNKAELDCFYEQYIEEGFEGQMVRLEAVYETKRSKNLLKRKEFQDEEYVILDVIEGVGNKSGVAGAMVFENELGISFNSNIKGNRDYLREVLENKQELIGQLATVKFFNKTPGNSLPRFPYVIAVRNFE